MAASARVQAGAFPGVHGRAGMARETILVVDDDAVLLRLSAAVLRSEGYCVHIASTAEQALTTLATLRPDLILVDLHLPGIDGPELTRRVRSQPRTKDIPVVAITASTSRADESRAYEAGCDGLINKPFDARALGQRLSVFIDGRADPAVRPEAGEAIPAGLILTGSETESLRRDFLADGSRQVERMLELAGARLDVDVAARLFHRWIGAAGVLGYMEIAEKTRAAETLLGKTVWTNGALREALNALARAFASPKEASETPIPESITEELRRKRVALVGFDSNAADKVCAALATANALPLLFDADEPTDSNAIRDCSVVMVHARVETLDSAWLQPESGTLPVDLPLVLVGAREHLLALDAKVQTRACEYLIDGWQPEEVVMRLSFAISRTATARPKAPTLQPAAETVGVTPRAERMAGGKLEILLADDDSHVLAVVRSALQGLGMECRTAASGPEALRMVRSLCPHAAVLDVNMPGMDGFEILSAIRQDGLPVRVVMLTACQNEKDILRGFNLGADDYVVKPFNPLELAARLKRLL